eukprot:jgi/Bigna1/128981/aug1.8_g3689
MGIIVFLLVSSFSQLLRAIERSKTFILSSNKRSLKKNSRIERPKNSKQEINPGPDVSVSQTKFESRNSPPVTPILRFQNSKADFVSEINATKEAKDSPPPLALGELAVQKDATKHMYEGSTTRQLRTSTSPTANICNNRRKNKARVRLDDIRRQLRWYICIIPLMCGTAMVILLGLFLTSFMAEEDNASDNADETARNYSPLGDSGFFILIIISIFYQYYAAVPITFCDVDD